MIKGVRICVVMHKWYHLRCLIETKVGKRSCDCGTECNGLEAALEMCNAGLEISVKQELQNDVTKVRQYAEMLESLIQRVDISSEMQSCDRENVYIRPRKFSRPMSNTNDFRVPLTNRYNALTIDSQNPQNEHFSAVGKCSNRPINKKCASENSQLPCTVQNTNRVSVTYNKEHRPKNETVKPKEEIFILSTSHGKGLAKIMSDIQSEYKVSGISKPGAPLQEVLKNCETTVKSGVNCVVIGGGNDVYKNESALAVKTLRQSLGKMSQAKVFLVSIPHRHDLTENSCVNKEIIKTNRKFRKICSSFVHTTFIEATSSIREHFTRHGLHRNNLGKKMLASEILEAIKTTGVDTHEILALPAIASLPMEEEKNVPTVHDEETFLATPLEATGQQPTSTPACETSLSPVESSELAVGDGTTEATSSQVMTEVPPETESTPSPKGGKRTTADEAVLSVVGKRKTVPPLRLNDFLVEHRKMKKPMK